ncbi:MAG: bifunctional 3,4-dihydroxy-2-butanone-4-phosphate synthase/GTP cyclohydrolase II [Candidatus Aureabacteria bacterium]|nr:bifunctional 3,4-dihydroxy-2-butanone-4-phosphate synthase/GTP cyclohydrolase II [Candidatus Auribacterota bacterium]
MPFSSIEEILEDYKQGKMVIVVDDEDRENEGDLVCAAELITPEKINFMAKFGRGLICVPMESMRLRKLGIYEMVPRSTDIFHTAFTVSVDVSEGVTTGISAYDRSQTIKKLIDESTHPDDFNKPGHVFPLIAREGGVLKRSGHTEASVDLSKICGLYPAGVICEIMNDDGTMARLKDLVPFAKKHDLKICTIVQLIEYRRKQEQLIEQIAASTLPTEHGDFRVVLFKSLVDSEIHIALIMGDMQDSEPCLVRVHSECLTGDVFFSKRCDCGKQLDSALSLIGKEKRGVLLYMRQEGRGIGLKNKILAYALQDKGLDTVEANHKLGFKADLRDYGIGAQILKALGLREIKLITNNPKKIIGLEGYGLKIVNRINMPVHANEKNIFYLKTKKEKLGHLFDQI